MIYEETDIRKGQDIFYYLLRRHELREDSQPELYRAYVESEQIQSLIRSQAEASDCKIERYGSVLYLIPNENNFFLGYSKSELKAKLCRSGATDKDYYLSQFVILTFLVEFYDGQSSSAKTRDYIRMGELQNSVAERLRSGDERYTVDEQEEKGIAFSDMLEAYEALRSDETGKKPKTTKEGFLHNIMVFLQNQGLVEYVEHDETVMTTKKLDNFMDWNLLNQNNFERVLKILGENDNGND